MLGTILTVAIYLGLCVFFGVKAVQLIMGIFGR